MKHKLKARLLIIRAWVVAHKKVSIGLGLTTVILLGFAIFALTGKEATEISRTEIQTVTEAEPEPEPVTVPSPLTGVAVSEEAAARPVTAVVIENSPDARPQSSLPDAGVVFEAIAEGGITRYLAFYQESRPSTIGPVRSLRPYFTDWALTFDASIAHVGGSATALAEVGTVGLKSLNQFAYGSSYIRTTDRFAPHNVYTDFDKLDALNSQLGYKTSEFDSFTRKAPKPAAVAKATNITVNISSFTYQSSYKWDRATNTYLRSMAGEPEKDRETSKQLAPSVVVVIEAPYSIASDGRYSYELVGSGKVTVFQDGNVHIGTWSKTARSAQMTFKADDGNNMRFNPGQMWMTVLSPSQEVEFTP